LEDVVDSAVLDELLEAVLNLTGDDRVLVVDGVFDAALIRVDQVHDEVSKPCFEGGRRAVDYRDVVDPMDEDREDQDKRWILVYPECFDHERGCFRVFG
jgi:hypothetical protein